MAKKKAQARPAPAPRFNLGRWYRHNKKAVHRGLIYAIAIVAGAAVLWVGYFALANRGVTLTKEEYVALARRAFSLGYFDQAILNYHKAQNAAPDDVRVARESFMARQRENLNRGGSFDLALAASYQVLAEHPESIVGCVSLAQLFEMRAQADSMEHYARTALQRAQIQDDHAATMATHLLLAAKFRTIDQQDSMFIHGRQALEAATADGDTFQVAFCRAGLGFSALRIDSLDLAERLFRELIDYRGRNGADVNDIGSAGLADYFQRRRELDSALVYLEPLREEIGSNLVDATTAYAARILGRVLRDQGQYDAAGEVLARSLEMWRTLRSESDVIDCLNDVAENFRLKRDLFNARKHYMAAGNLAKEVGLPRRDKYSADLNVVFLQSLKPDEYRRAGEEGIALARQYYEP
jgi:tetratricopeptide (TPR) repeat protein